MPKFFEVFCKKDQLDEIKSSLSEGTCPLSNSICDGGGNRHQTKLRQADIDTINNLGVKSIGADIPAICSIDYGDEAWIVCPRRLLAFSKGGDGVKRWLKNHERYILLNAGFNQGQKIAIFSEVYLKYNDGESDINYHFDYVAFPIIECDLTLDEFMSRYEVNDRAVSIKARNILFAEGTQSIDNKKSCNRQALDFSTFSILEVMTASTSGSNSSKGTDIKSAYLKMLAGHEYECPGINKRQVWGRMTTQLFAKTAIAEEWGGRTYWVVQDQLLKNIEKTTKLGKVRTSP